MRRKGGHQEKKLKIYINEEWSRIILIVIIELILIFLCRSERNGRKNRCINNNGLKIFEAYARYFCCRMNFDVFQKVGWSLIFTLHTAHFDA